MSVSRHVERIHFRGAEEFVDFLRPSAQNWGPLIDHACPWVYRGQSNAQWRLIPSAWRPEAKTKIEAIKRRLRPIIEDRLQWDMTDLDLLACTRDRAVDHIFQVTAESELVLQFGALADELGHPVPDLEKVRLPRRDLGRYVKGQVFDGPMPNLAFALAQHHGIPTRLLDWTRRGLVAAFFAAEGLEHLRAQGQTPTRLAVWALNREAGKGSDWSFLTCPRHRFSFLHAQDGLFTWLWNGDAFFVEHGVWPAFEEHIEPYDTTRKPVRKLTLPVKQADAVLKILWSEGISRAHLMPTYDNVTTSLWTKLNWR